MMKYEEQLKNQTLDNFMPRTAPASREEMVESVIMDSHGLSTKDVKQQLQERHDLHMSVKEIQDVIMEINRKYADEIGKHMIVSRDERWCWRR